MTTFEDVVYLFHICFAYLYILPVVTPYLSAISCFVGLWSGVPNWLLIRCTMITALAPVIPVVPLLPPPRNFCLVRNSDLSRNSTFVRIPRSQATPKLPSIRCSWKPASQLNFGSSRGIKATLSRFYNVQIMEFLLFCILPLVGNEIGGF